MTTAKTRQTESQTGRPVAPNTADAAPGQRRETQALMCRLTDDEQRVRGVELADAQKNLSLLTEEKRALGDRLKSCQATIERLAETVKHRQEERPVECLLTPDLAADTMTTVRTDNGEVVSIRQLTASERRQLMEPQLPGVESDKR